VGTAAVVAALALLAAPTAALAQQFPGIFTVDRTTDGNDGECSNDCTLREAVSLATPGQTTSITLRPGVYRLTNGPLVLANSVVILGTGVIGGQGAGARTTIIDARQRSRVVEVPAGTSSILAGVTITGGSATNGGGILVGPEAILNVHNAVVDGNVAAARGGAIHAQGNVSLLNSTVSGNRVNDGSGGAIAVDAGGEAIVLASTLTGNAAAAGGGGIRSAGNLVIQNVTIAGNAGGGLLLDAVPGAAISMWNTIVAGAGAGSACGGAITGVARGTFSHNLADDTSCAFATTTEGTVGNPRLGPLRNNGGATDTRALQAGSPAIDAGDPQLCGSPDQRFAPPVGTCDIGAFEFGGRPPEVQLPPPVAGETVNVSRARGTVKIKLPGSDEFFELEDGQQVPVGSTFDTSKGRVNLQAAGSQRAWFYQGVFRLGQTRRAKPLSTLTLTARLNCGRAQAYTAQRRKRKRRLWGDGRGRFRTKGEFSSATVRGTRWLVEDRCNGTLTRVTEGRVAVRDFVRKRTVVVRAGRQYLAKRRR
jgi:CSLREA domain-containing protein